MSKLPKPHIFTQAESKPLRWGVFGAGWIVDAMLKTAQVNSNQKFIAVASRTPGKAQASAWLYSPRLVFTNSHCVHNIDLKPQKVIYEASRMSAGLPGTVTNTEIEHTKASKIFTYDTFEWYDATAGGRPVNGTKCYRDGLSAMGYDKDKNLVTLLCSFKNSPGAFPGWTTAN